MAERVFFHATTVYGVNPEDGCLKDRYPGDGEDNLLLVDIDITLDDLRLPFWVTGIQRHDLAVFGASIRDEGTDDHGFLVVSSSQGQGQLATPELIEGLDFLCTPELAKKFATLQEHELAQLGIVGLVSKIRRMYPEIKGYAR